MSNQAHTHTNLGGLTMNQKDATYNAIVTVTGHKDGVLSITPEQRKQVNNILFQGFRAGKIDLTVEFDDKELMSYVSGLQSNWIRKDKRFNGNVKYEAKNPGSRAGTGDAQLTSLRALHRQLTAPDEKAEVQGYIDARVTELTVAKQVVIDPTMLPDALKKFIK